MIFAAYFILRGRDTFNLCSSMRLFRVLSCLISPLIAHWILIILSDFLFGRECDGFLQCFVMLGPARSVFSMAGSDIQISKNGLQLKLKLHKLRRMAM